MRFRVDEVESQLLILANFQSQNTRTSANIDKRYYRATNQWSITTVLTYKALSLATQYGRNRSTKTSFVPVTCKIRKKYQSDAAIVKSKEPKLEPSGDLRRF